MPGPDSLSDGSWRSVVRVKEDPSLAAELSERFSRATGARAPSVTELLEPRRAFWRRRVAVRVPPEREERIDLGRSWHRRVGPLLGTPGALEVVVRGEGVVGRIDVLRPVLTEVKVTGALPAVHDLPITRPEYLEQLAMYGALSSQEVGRLVLLRPVPPDAFEVRATEMSLEHAPRVLGEIRRRAKQFQASLAAGRPGDLPRCRWFGRGCELQSAGACDCAGNEASPGSELLDCVGPIAERPVLEQELRTALSGAPPTPEGGLAVEVRDLVYPRRAYFRRTLPLTPELVLPDRPDYRRLIEAVEGGPTGEIARAPGPPDGPDEGIETFRGAPYIARTTRARARVAPQDLLLAQPQYAMDLGLRCAATGTDRARLFLVHEQERRPDRVRAFEFSLDSRTPFSRLWRQRAGQISDALAAGEFERLPPCPAWMFRDCPYRETCACGPGVGRDQR